MSGEVWESVFGRSVGGVGKCVGGGVEWGVEGVGGGVEKVRGRWGEV